MKLSRSAVTRGRSISPLTTVNTPAFRPIPSARVMIVASERIRVFAISRSAKRTSRARLSIIVHPYGDEGANVPPSHVLEEKLDELVLLDEACSGGCSATRGVIVCRPRRTVYARNQSETGEPHFSRSGTTWTDGRGRLTG